MPFHTVPKAASLTTAWRARGAGSSLRKYGVLLSHTSSLSPPRRDIGSCMNLALIRLLFPIKALLEERRSVADTLCVRRHVPDSSSSLQTPEPSDAIDNL